MDEGYEFPVGMFGYVPPWLPMLIGKGVMVAALVEGKVDALLMNLDTNFQSTHAGKPVLSNIRACRSRLDGIESRFPDLASTTRPLLADVEAALQRRNSIVHSLWPANTAAVAKGWRNLPPNQRSSAEDGTEPTWTDWIEMEPHKFVQLLDELEELVARLTAKIAESGPVNSVAL